MKKAFVFMVLCGICVSLSAQSGDKPASSQPVSPALSAIQTANSLAKYGYSVFSASALIGAAEILVRNQTRSLDASPTAEAAGAGGGAKTVKPEFTPLNLLADAKRYASMDSTMLAWADAVEKSIATTRGSAGGPKQGVFSVNARGTDRFSIAFTARSLAEVLVSGDGDTDLDLYVYDSNNNLIASSEDYSDDCYVSWVPAWTGTFIIKVVNRGGVYNRYAILTN
jgi:hypothetical protein